MTDIAVAEEQVGAVTLFGTDNPAEVVDRASRVAQTLADIVRKQKLTVRIGNGEHVRVEGWTLLGSMLGVFPVVTWTRPVLENDEKVGWEARVEARTRLGETVGAAEAECLRSEKEWGPNPTKGKMRDDYALRSMAQTRAVSKAMRMPLGFVMQLAGFNPTPAEEMPQPGTVQHPEGEVVDDGKFPPDIDMPPPATIEEKDRRRLRAEQKRVGMTDERLKELVREIAGVESSKDIPRVRYDALLSAVKKAYPEGFQVPESLR